MLFVWTMESVKYKPGAILQQVLFIPNLTLTPTLTNSYYYYYYYYLLQKKINKKYTNFSVDLGLNQSSAICAFPSHCKLG